MNRVERHAIRVGKRVRYRRSWWGPEVAWWIALTTIAIVLAIGVAAWAMK